MLESVLEFIKTTHEYQGFGFNRLTFWASGTVAFTVLEWWGLWKQKQKIWTEKSGKSVSITLMTFGFFSYLAFIFYGIWVKSGSSVFNGILSIPYIPILWGLWKFKRFTWWEKTGFWVFAMMVPAMAFFPEYHNEIFLVISFGIIGALLTMPLELYKAGETGVVEVRTLLAFIAATIFWVFYAFSINEWVLEFLSSVNLFILFGTTFLWLWYYKKEKRLS
ncbi:MAG: hypothetical protein HYT27_03300 [Parcubacteria group bacterium]|nr:hypothetical protein [Parcubacteria group bacterium]